MDRRQFLVKGLGGAGAFFVASRLLPWNFLGEAFSTSDKAGTLLTIPHGTSVAEITARVIGARKMGWDFSDNLLTRLLKRRMGATIGSALILGFHYWIDEGFPFVPVRQFFPSTGRHKIEWSIVVTEAGEVSEAPILTFFVYVNA